MKRFSRLELLLGKEALDRLAAARVTVVGLGAVGSYAVEGLVRAGVGTLRLVDFDTVHASNINRQLYAMDSTMGRPKTDIAAARVLDINPDCHVEAMQVFVDQESVEDVLTPVPDVVIDAIDSVGPKIELLRACAQKAIFTVSSMGAACRMDPTMVRVDDIGNTVSCPLARHIRRHLRQLGVEKGIKCIYSTEPVPPPAGDPASFVEAEEAMERGRKRRPLGSFSCLTGIFGLTAAREAIMQIIGK